MQIWNHHFVRLNITLATEPQSERVQTDIATNTEREEKKQQIFDEKSLERNLHHNVKKKKKNKTLTKKTFYPVQSIGQKRWSECITIFVLFSGSLLPNALLFLVQVITKYRTLLIFFSFFFYFFNFARKLIKILAVSIHTDRNDCFTHVHVYDEQALAVIRRENSVECESREK